MSNENGEMLIIIIKVIATIIVMIIGAFAGAFIGAFKAPFYIGLFDDSSFEMSSIKEKIKTGMKDKI
jgi:hypothetical protein